ncbi:MAG: carboxypeptidase regulatory-like domain-containing protein [Gemmatimonadaceae bacterium]
MQHLDEGTIHAWLDGALAPNEASAAEAHVQTCAQCASMVAEARGLVAASSRILAALDDVPAVQEPRTLPIARRRAAPWWRRAGVGYAAAATAFLAVGTTIILQRMPADQAFQAAAPVASETRSVQPDVTVLESIVPPPARSAAGAANEVGGDRRLSASARSRNLKDGAAAKEEFAVDRIVQLPGAMPRPAAPVPPGPVRQEAERKALADVPADDTVPARGALVQGRVLDAATGAPVVGATVSVDSARARTDSDGKFKLQPVPLGQQTVSVRALGFQPAQHQVAVVPRDSVDHGFTLQKSAAQRTEAVITGAAAAREQQSTRASGLRDSLQRAQQAAPPVLRLEDIRAHTANILGCYSLRVTSDKERDANRSPVFAMPTRVELEGRAQERAHREEPVVNRARKLAGSGDADSWRFIGDSLELTVVDGTRRRVLRFARENSRWVSQEFVLERCATSPN